MLLDLVIVACVALAGAGLGLGACRLLRLAPGHWVGPVAAGLAMMAYLSWARYTWFERTVSALPPEVRVVASFPYDGVLEPWTRLFPRISKLVAIDEGAVLRHPTNARMVLVTTLLVEEYEETLVLHQIVDCAARRRAVVGPKAHFDADGTPEGVTWIESGEPAYLFDALCRDP